MASEREIAEAVLAHRMYWAEQSSPVTASEFPSEEGAIAAALKAAERVRDQEEKGDAE